MGIFTGPASAAKAARLIMANPKLIGLALIPALVTCAVSCLGIGLAIVYGDDLVTLVWAEPEAGWLHWIWWGLIQLVKLSSIFLAVFITPWLIILLGMPLSGPLASAADALLGGDEVPTTLMSSIRSSITGAISLTFIGLMGNAVFFILGLIPTVGLISTPFAAFIWTPLILCYDLYDGAMSRRDAPVKKRIQTVLSRPFTSLSVGLTGLFLLYVPLLNLLGLPIAVVAGVIAIREREERGDLRTS